MANFHLKPDEKLQTAFPSTARRSVSFRLTRFETIAETYWEHSFRSLKTEKKAGGGMEKIDFKVDQDITLEGFGFHGPITSGKSFKTYVLLFPHDSYVPSAELEATHQSDGTSKLYWSEFDKPVAIKCDKKYTLTIQSVAGEFDADTMTFSGETERNGSMTLEGIEFTFSPVVDENHRRGTDFFLKHGRLGGLIFHK